MRIPRSFLFSSLPPHTYLLIILIFFSLLVIINRRQKRLQLMRIRQKDVKKLQLSPGQEGTYRRKPTPVKRYAGDLLAPVSFNRTKLIYLFSSKCECVNSSQMLDCRWPNWVFRMFLWLSFSQPSWRHLALKTLAFTSVCPVVAAPVTFIFIWHKPVGGQKKIVGTCVWAMQNLHKRGQ